MAGFDTRVSRVPVTELTGEDLAELRLSWHLDPAAHQDLDTEMFGKRILVTDHDDWPISDLVTAYRSQSQVFTTYSASGGTPRNADVGSTYRRSPHPE
jgi:hypothetical protein